jgi:hypothetical protein
LSPEVGDLLQQIREAGTPPPTNGREIGACKERLLFWGQKDRHRPATLAVIHRNRGGHVNFIEIRSLLPIDFDADEVPIHQGGD